MASIIGVETLQHTNGTTAATIDSSGRINKPETPHIELVGNNANEITSKYTSETYTNWNVTSNKGITFDSSTGRITVPIAGKYLVTPTFYIWADTVDTHTVVLRVNGTNFQEFILEFANLRSGNTRIDETIGQAVILDLDANDYIDFRCNADIYGGSTHTNCQMILLA